MYNYKLFDYGWMINPLNQARVDGYAKSLRKAVTPDSVVLEIGAGIGFFSLLAAKYGARRVYAVEPNPAIDTARELAAANGFGDRIECISDMSTRLELPEKADVIISDLRGSLPFAPSNIPSIVDARTRLLADDGVLIPRKDLLWVAVVEAPELYWHFDSVWGQQEGLDLGLVQRKVTTSLRKCKIKGEGLLVEPELWHTIDYEEVTGPNAEGNVEWEVARPGTGHGVAVWFDTELAEDISFSNRPGQSELPIYGHLFFPWTSAVTVSPEDRISLTLRADLVGSEYIWQWASTVTDVRTGETKASFKQSNFSSKMPNALGMRKVAEDHVPILGEAGNLDAEILSLMDGKRSLGEIASELSHRFPERFPTRRDALTHVGEMSLRYGV